MHQEHRHYSNRYHDGSTDLRAPSGRQNDGSRKQVYTGECPTVTGQSADARANRLSQEAYLFDLRARP